jgi:hypothetical protein
MNARLSLLTVTCVLVAVATPLPAQDDPTAAPRADVRSRGRVPAFSRRVLSRDYTCDGINAGDFNRDGTLDVVAGPYWYEGPAFERRYEFFAATLQDGVKGQSNSMYSYVYDFNQDGWLDVLVLGRVHMHPAYCYENPRGQGGLWPRHFVFERVRGESPPFCDIDGDGKPELIGHWENRWGLIAPDRAAPTKPWSFHPITEPGDYNQFYHGTGVGDVNGDGRADLILNEGWWEQPASSAVGSGKAWIAHPYRFGDRGGAQMFAYDVDGDGDNDIITALDAHGWGLAWFEQVRERTARDFRRHVIMGDRTEEPRHSVAFSQPHALDLADIDGDGLLDIVAGKRRWAHGPSGDVEPGATPVLYWFQLVRGSGGAVSYRPHLIDDELGVGVQIVARDVNGDGATDVLTASKLGSAVYLSVPQSRKSADAP